MAAVPRAVEPDPPGSRLANVPQARRAHGSALVDRIVAASFAPDAPADALVAAFRTLPGGAGWRMVDAALAGERVAGAPPELEAVVGPALEPPAWVDLDLVDVGAVARWNVSSLTQALALTAGSLAFGYQSAALSGPLAATGRLTRMAPRRLGETSRWVVAATAPGALRPGGAGVRATVRLRLVHALVRAHLLRGGWDVADRGMPLSVADTLATGIGGFLVVPQRALADLGVHHSPAELEAQAMQWRWICSLMGVPDAEIPTSYGACERWMACALDLEAGPHEQSPELMDALLRHALALERLLPAPAAVVTRQLSRHGLGALTRRWMGDEMADRLGVPDTPLKHAVPLLRPFNAARGIVLATGALGDARRVAALEVELVDRVLGLLRAAPAQLAPEDVEQAPAVTA